MATSVTPFLMFEGRAEEAMTFYVSVFRRAQISQIERWAAGEDGREGSIKRASFRIGGLEVQCSDSPVGHAFTFTPSLSLFVECESEAEQSSLYGQLSNGGETLMPLASYGFSKLFVWVNDRFGVSWQLNLR
jgi:predicted 3-demethylubiquinone-9 3-methyltransferase (glyoxalase superfamily)